MSHVGIFGGTFDPVHYGHLITAQSVKEIRNLDKIIFIPSYISPYKQDKKSSDAKHRLKMLKIACKKAEGFEVSDIEIKAGSVSYTIDTLKKYQKKYTKIDLIIGYDNLLDFAGWKDAEKILDIAQIVVLKREIEKNQVKKDIFFNSAIFVETPVIEISGTEIRSRVQKGLPIDFLVPEKVKEYIYTFKLYKD